MMSTLVSLNQISKGFQVKEDVISVIRDINLEINFGEVISVIGPSGCGKTTLIKIIANILNPDSGTVSFKGDKISNARKSYSIGYVPQHHTLLPNRTVLQNITLPLEIEGEKNLEFAYELLRLMDLEKYKDYYPSQISGGMKQKVSIARALVYNPEVLLLDEPFASVDEISREKYNLELLRLNKVLKRSIILVTHNIEEAVFMSDRILIMSSSPGKILNETKISLGENRNADTRLGSDFFSATSIIRKLIKNNE